MLGSSLVGLVIGEISLRAIGYAGDQERQKNVLFGRYGTLLKNSWAWSFEVDPTAQSTVRFREQTVALKNNREKTRILFIGDSGTKGTGVRIEEAFPAQFKQQLDSHHRNNDVEIVNAGVWGMTTIGEYHFFQDKLLVLQPDIVVLGLFMSNDINFNLGHREPAQNLGSLTHRVLKAMRQRSALVHLGVLRAMTINHRYSLFDSSWANEDSLIPVELRLIDANGFNMLSYPVGETATYLKEPSALIDRAFERLERVFVDFVELGQENGFAFRVLIIPSPSAVVGELTLLHFQEDTYRFLEESGVRVRPDQLDFSIPTRRVLDICARHEIVCVDPTELLQKIGLEAFFPGDEHNTRVGHAALATKLVEQWESIRQERVAD